MFSKRRGSRPDLKFANATLLQKRGDPGSQNHVAANGERSVHQEIEPVGVVGGFLQPKRTLNAIPFLSDIEHQYRIFFLRLQKCQCRQTRCSCK